MSQSQPYPNAHQPQPYAQPRTFSQCSPNFAQSQTHSTPPQVNYYPPGPDAVPRHPQTDSQWGAEPGQPSVVPSQPFSHLPPQTASNPRIALGAIPDPPNYDQAAYLPSHPPTPYPLPPPISLSQTNPISTADSPSQTGFPLDGPPPQDPSTVTNNPGPNCKPSQDTNLAVPAQGTSAVSGPSESGSQVESPAQGSGVIPRTSESGSQAESSSNTAIEINIVPESNASSTPPLQVHIEETSDRELALAKREKALAEMEKDLQQAAKDQLQQVLDEKLQLIQQEQERMKKEREEERTQFQDYRDQLQHEQEQLRKEHQQLQHDREEVQQQAEEIRQLRSQYEKEVAVVRKEGEQQLHYWEQLRQQETQQQLVMSTGLPSGWEKRLDRNTGRFYYVDHSSKTTHWNPPTHLLQYQAELQRQKQQAAASSLPAQPGVSPALLPHSASIPRPVQPGTRGETGHVIPDQPKGPVPPQGQVPVPSQGQVPMPPHVQTAVQGVRKIYNSPDKLGSFYLFIVSQVLE